MEKIKQGELTKGFLELIRRTATDLPVDVERCVRKCCSREGKGSISRNVLSSLLDNIKIGRNESTPICQDTGYPTFYISHPYGVRQAFLERSIRKSLNLATRKCYLRPNSVNSITGKNEGENTGLYFPYIYFNEWKNRYTEIKLILKGGGCENVGAQYKLPDARLNAARDLDGVSKCIVDMVMNAQGRGCAPGTLGVGIGGDRTISYSVAKKQFLRKLGDRNSIPMLDRMEKNLLKKINSLGIGPMGLGGKTTVLDVKIGYAYRVPACYFVSISYMCWAFRRRKMIINPSGSIIYEKD